MSWTRLLFDDEGEISRKSWWAGTLLLILVHAVLEYFSARFMKHAELDRSFMLFVSLAILLPFYSVNAKRFRAIGRSESFAFIGGLLPGIVVLCDAFIGLPILDFTFGLALLAVMIWYIIDLGVIDHDSVIDLQRRRV